MTFVGDPDFGEESKRGMLIRRGTAGNIRNSIVMGFKSAGVNIDSLATFAQAQQGKLVIDNNIFFNNSPNFDTDAGDPDAAGLPFTTEQFMTQNMTNNLQGDPKLNDPYNLEDPDFRPAADSPAVNGSLPVAAPPAGNTFIVATDYLGAVDPDDDWTRQPWTTYGTAEWTEPTSTTTTVPSTTTTTPGGICPAVEIYGEGSEEVGLLRSVRDQVLRTSPEGRELIKMYYQLSPVMVQALKADPAFKAELKELADEFLNTVN